MAGVERDNPALKGVLGRVYEYFLSQFASAEGKKGGEFYTPRCVVKLLVEMLEPYRGRVCDPWCGSSGMFVQSVEFIRAQEVMASRSQNAILNVGRGGTIKYLPFAFTEHGAVMAATVLNSAQAVHMSILIVRAFIELRAWLSANAVLARKLDALTPSQHSTRMMSSSPFACLLFMHAN
jgi:hypothetical protein